MTVSAARFELALRELRPSDWERFERLSSAFLAADFSDFRTMASPAGDRGRDAELRGVEGVPNTLFQFSVRSDWEAKVTETLKRVKAEFPNTTAIVFVSISRSAPRATGSANSRASRVSPLSCATELGSSNALTPTTAADRLLANSLGRLWIRCWRVRA